MAGRVEYGRAGGSTAFPPQSVRRLIRSPLLEANAARMPRWHGRCTADSRLARRGIRVGPRFRLWIEEADKKVWHIVTRRIDARRYDVACGWEMGPRLRMVWPQKPAEAGPAHGERCHSCAALDEALSG